MSRERELTFDERAVWGECPVCHAKDGEKCDSAIGLTLGVNVNGVRPTEGAHLARIQDAPLRVRLVPI